MQLHVMVALSLFLFLSRSLPFSLPVFFFFFCCCYVFLLFCLLACVPLLRLLPFGLSHCFETCVVIVACFLPACEALFPTK